MSPVLHQAWSAILTVRRCTTTACTTTALPATVCTQHPSRPRFAGIWVRYYVEATAANTAKSVSYLPVGAEHDVFIYKVLPASTSSAVVAGNEIMASNTATVTDEAGEYDDWIELYNTGAQAVDLSGWFITDNPDNLDKWTSPPAPCCNRVTT